jgi:flagellar biosynthesis GTPase FlhF
MLSLTRAIRVTISTQIVSIFHRDVEHVTTVASESRNRSANAERPLKLNSHSRRENRKPRRDERGHKGRSAPCQDSKCVQKRQRNEHQRQRPHTRSVGVRSFCARAQVQSIWTSNETARRGSSTPNQDDLTKKKKKKRKKNLTKRKQTTMSNYFSFCTLKHRKSGSLRRSRAWLQRILNRRQHRDTVITFSHCWLGLMGVDLNDSKDDL